MAGRRFIPGRPQVPCSGSNPMITDPEKDTAEFSLPPAPAAALPRRSASSRVQVDLGALSHPGHVRENNEDMYLVVRANRAWQTLLTNLPAGSIPERAEEVAYGMLVADGMGGMAAGEVA